MPVVTGPEEGTENAKNLQSLRSALTKDIQDCEKIETTCVPPAVQEVVLARRALEDARMRLGVALTYVNGKQPFEEEK